jgi:hypothetical protein
MPIHNFPLFARYIGIDYSGAASPTCSLKGLRVYSADRKALPIEIHPPQRFSLYFFMHLALFEFYLCNAIDLFAFTVI